MEGMNREPVAKWEPQIERRYSPDGLLLSEKVKYTPDGEWQSLTDEEVAEILDYGEWKHVPQYARNFVDAISAKLKEKNT
ncbi:MAG: hypothetical protein EBY68_06500 [Actinobacteria bacterium]|nr:hypothetical protein [Actinomycetota bacterium]